MDNKKEKLFKFIISILVYSIPLFIFTYCLLVTVAPGDSTEMLTSALTLGIPHQPSFPVNTIIGHIFYLLPLPIGEIARINFASAVIQSLTVLTFFFLLTNLLSNEKGKNILNYLIAASASMFMAFSGIFWQYAEKFEVFPLNNLFAVLLLLLALVYKKGNYKKTKLFLLFLFIWGLAFTHHQTIILIIPAILFLFSGPIISFLDKNWERYEEWKGRKNKHKRLIKLNFEARKNDGGNTFFSKIKPLSFISAFILGILPFLLLLKISSTNPLMNWGDIKDLRGVYAALIRNDYGTFSPFVVGNEVVEKNYPIDQIIFYFENILYDFSIIGVVFFVLGVIYLWKNDRKTLIFISLGWVFAGIIFLSYANFPVSGSFEQATLRRFYMLPNIFIAMFIAYGIKHFINLLEKYTIDLNGGKMSIENAGIVIGKIVILLSFLFPLIINYPKASLKGDSLTRNYAIDAFSKTEENSLILLSGDIPNMVSDYYRLVELKTKDNRIVFTPGQFHLSWFIPQLKGRHPDLIIPDPYPDKMFTSTTQIIDANYGKRPIYIEPGLSTKDPQIEDKYTLWPKDLLFLVKKKGEDLKLEDYRNEGNLLWARIDLDLIKKVSLQKPNFDETIVFYYSRHFYNLGYVYEEVSLYDDAIREYKRVLIIDPYFKEALSSLGRVYGYKLENPVYSTAIDYLQKYQSLLTKEEEELGNEAQGMIEELKQKSEDEYQKSLEEENAPKEEIPEETNLLVPENL